jgi:CHAT domain-containing protein
MFKDLIGDLLDKATDLKRLVVVPSGALLSLPPDLLIMKPPIKGSAPDWLARHYAILVAPDVRSLERLRGVAKPQALGTTFFGIGNPSFAGNAATGAAIRATGPCADHRNVRTEVASLPALPDTEDEVRAMSVALGQGKSEILLRDRARKSSLRMPAFANADILVFATHGLLPQDLYCEDEPSLALAPGPAPDDDGLLRASEVSAMRLKANLVVLSACNTAGADGRLSGEALSGLVRAFFFAGGRNVLATHWAIASRQTVALTTGMISRAAKGMPLADALQSAKLDLMNAKDTAHPIFWAAFELVGGG